MTATVDNDTAEKGTSGPFKPWEGDHTALVHVLWAAKHAGLTLDKNFDEIASMVLRSRFMAARLAAHDAQVAERAWDEGFDRGFYSGQSMRSDADASESPVQNPYEAARIEGGTPT